jgi:mRNA-degrading endonuclease YafQ of YafQ-DinJ toxin-antitoxin module
MSWKIKNTAFFTSQYKLLPRHIQNTAKGVFEILIEDPYDPSLSTHALKKPLASYNGISVTDDYRIIARIVPSRREIILHDIGTHDIYQSFIG